MKNTIQALLLTFSFLIAGSVLKAGEKHTVGKFSLSANQPKELNVSKLKGEIKKALARPSTISVFTKRTFRPKLSVDLLDNAGLHLFTISNLNPIPTIKVGARFNAGLIITI